MVPIKKILQKKKRYMCKTPAHRKCPKTSICSLLSFLLLFCTFYPPWFSEILGKDLQGHLLTIIYLPQPLSLSPLK